MVLPTHGLSQLANGLSSTLHRFCMNMIRGVIPLEFGVQAPLSPPKSGISPSLHTSPMECTGQGMLGATACISETLSLAIGCAPLLLWLQCQSRNCDQSTVGTTLILMCLPPYDTGLNSGHKVCFNARKPP